MLLALFRFGTSGGRRWVIPIPLVPFWPLIALFLIAGLISLALTQRRLFWIALKTLGPMLCSISGLSIDVQPRDGGCFQLRLL